MYRNYFLGTIEITNYTDSIVATKVTKLFSDALISFLEDKKVSSDIITKLQDYINGEEYDTDSIHIDIEGNIGNITGIFEDKTINARVNQFLIANKGILCL